MAVGYAKRKTVRLYDGPTGSAFKMVLIFGDAVDRSGIVESGRERVTFRGQEGFIKATDLGDTPSLEMYFIDVGQGDAAFIITPGRKKILIDGGYNRRALGFLTWLYRLDKTGAQPVDIDMLIMSHGDGDHLEGLIPIVRHPLINIKRILHNGLANFDDDRLPETLGQFSDDGKFITTRHSALSDLPDFTLSGTFSSWKLAVENEASIQSYESIDSRTGAIDLGEPDVTLEVLGPRIEQVNGADACRWFGNHAHTINGHSVVFRLTYKEASALFSGDLNIEGSLHLLSDPDIATRLDAHVFKTPHHGSHEFANELFAAIQPQISVVSSGDSPDHGHPRASFLGVLGRHHRSPEPLLFSTEIAATFHEDRSDRGEETSLEGLSVTDPEDRRETRIRFKRRLHGMINVRTDGQKLYSARRVATGYWWESYESPVALREP
jgi:beta-lactamase superfamily II metal-dependent hydrolase